MGSHSRSIAVACALVGLGVQTAHASQFEVTPVRIELSPRASSVLLALRNQSGDAIRFQVSAFAWSQDQAGKMQLAPTQDILFFPSLLTVQAGQLRNIRIGA